MSFVSIMDGKFICRLSTECQHKPVFGQANLTWGCAPQFRVSYMFTLYENRGYRSIARPYLFGFEVRDSIRFHHSVPVIKRNLNFLIF